MKQRFPWGWTVAAGSALLVGVVAWVVVQQQIPQQLALASGFKAKTLSAGLFIQGLDQPRLEAEDSGFNGMFALL